MPKPYTSRDDALADGLSALKRHLKSCKQCTGARKAASPHGMCRAGMQMILDAAERYDVVIKLRIAAHNSLKHTVIACPDPSKHGRSYALTAQPLVVTGFQDRLF